MGKVRLGVAFALGIAIGAAVGVGLVRGQAQPQRSILSRLDIAGTDREAAIGTAQIPAGAAIARHYHPGEELAFVAEGELVLKIEGRGDTYLKAGDVYAVPRGVVHEAAPANGKDARVIAVWVTDKGQPLAVSSP